MKNIALTLIAFLIATTIIAQAGNQPTTTLHIEDDEPLISWKLNRESNTAYFVIEASTQNEAFTPIATIPAAGYALQTTEYSHPIEAIDTSVQYRVVLVCMDGQRIVSKSASYDLESATRFAASNQ